MQPIDGGPGGGSASHISYHGLFSYQEQPQIRGICWLRVLSRSDEEGVAVLTDVPCNPGRSVVNGIEGFASAIYEQVVGDFGTCHWFTSWLSESDGEADFTGVRFDDPVTLTVLEFTPWVQREEVEQLAGARLPTIPAHEKLRNLVLAAGGEEEEEEQRRSYSIFPVERFPPPHNPARCAHYSRFKKMSAAPPDEGSPGEMFLSSLTMEDFAVCSYHDGDWNQVAATSVAILEALGSEPEDEVLRETISLATLAEREKLMLFWLFFDPIVASPDHGFTNGQHRACAIRASGARRVVVAD